MECTEFVAQISETSFLELESAGGNASDACLAVAESLVCYFGTETKFGRSHRRLDGRSGSG